MIKEYFTDGLIGLVIILSLFRTDLIGINNLINYPEVQDIILGQTAAYIPANFHHIHNSHVFTNPKNLDFDNQAFSAWYQGLNSLPLFRERRQFDIEAFLVSSHHEHLNEHFQEEPENIILPESHAVSQISLPALREESVNILREGELNPLTFERSNASAPVEESLTHGQTVVDVSSILNNSSPCCNLTKEDLKLIDILFQQDVDLGIGKEVFDPSMREELQREQELEYVKQQEKQKVLLLAKEKKEREEQELRDRWLKENFSRDGETGEWVQLQSWNGGKDNLQSLPLLDTPDALATFTFEDALEFLGELEKTENTAVSFSQPDQVEVCVPEIKQFETQQHQPVLEHQDSLEESLIELVDYLNPGVNSVSGDEFIQLTDDFLSQSPVEDLQGDYLIHNATLPSASLDLSADLNVLTPIEDLNSSMPLQSSDVNSTLDFGLGDFGLFNNFTDLQSENMSDIDMNELVDPFGNMTDVISETTMDKTHDLASESEASTPVLQNSLHSTVTTTGRSSPYQELSDALDSLEGATGGYDIIGDHGEMNDQLVNFSYLSESSNDSGFANQGGFSSPSSSSSSSSSLYAGSPAGSHSGTNSSTPSNDTREEPRSRRAVAHHHIGHNHTYNTPPGQLPREVKKYAQKEPSHKGPQSKDQHRADELKVPFSLEEIIESPVEVFNEMLTLHRLSEAQLILIRDIRRRGKNKVAAQNCRKRKVGVIYNLADEMVELQKMRDRLMEERAAMDQERRKIKEKCGHLYTHIFESLRDERGEPYDPNLFSLQQSSDGNVFLVPRNLTINGKNGSTSSSSSSSGSKSRKSTGR